MNSKLNVFIWKPVISLNPAKQQSAKIQQHAYQLSKYIQIWVDGDSGGFTFHIHKLTLKDINASAI